MNRVRRLRPLLQKMDHLLKSGVVKEPVWYEAMRKVPPAEVPMRASKPKTLEYEEDALVDGFLQQNPSFLKNPITLYDPEPILPRKFAFRQLELMKEGYSKQQAYDITEVEMEQSLLEMQNTTGGPKDTLKSMQDIEEAILQKQAENDGKNKGTDIGGNQRLEDLLLYGDSFGEDPDWSDEDVLDEEEEYGLKMYKDTI